MTNLSLGLSRYRSRYRTSCICKKTLKFYVFRSVLALWHWFPYLIDWSAVVISRSWPYLPRRLWRKRQRRRRKSSFWAETTGKMKKKRFSFSVKRYTEFMFEIIKFRNTLLINASHLSISNYLPGRVVYPDTRWTCLNCHRFASRLVYDASISVRHVYFNYVNPYLVYS